MFISVATQVVMKMQSMLRGTEGTPQLDGNSVGQISVYWGAAGRSLLACSISQCLGQVCGAGRVRHRAAKWHGGAQNLQCA